MEKFKKLWRIGIFWIAFLCLEAASVQAQLVHQSELDGYFLRLQEEQGFSGTVLIADENGILLQKGYGNTNEEENVPMTVDTVLLVGSISKQFTAAAILHLEAQGKLNVADPISQFFPNAPLDKADITLHQLLTHSAGFTSEHFDDDLTPMNKQQALSAIFALELGLAPGQQYEYSNTGYTLLAAVIEEVTGQSYTRYLHDQFFKPLGMNQTGFFNDDWKNESVANGYWSFIDNDKPSTFPGPYWGILGNGGVMSTVGDMHTWWQALKAHKVLSPEQTEKMFTRHISEGWEDSFYGYGWVLTDTEYGPAIWHDGAGLGGSAEFRMYTKEGLILIILSNRISLCTTLDIIPVEPCFPAGEALEQVVSNIHARDFSQLPPAPLSPGVVFWGVIGMLVMAVGVFLYGIKHRFFRLEE